MSLTQIATQYPVFNDLDGTPLDAGYIYIGVANQNPEINQVAVFWDQNLTLPAAQPIRTINGYPSRVGTPSNLYTNGPFSITVRNKARDLVIYSAGGVPVRTSAGLVEYQPLTGAVTNVQDQMNAYEGGTGADLIGFTPINASDPISVGDKLKELRISVKDFGALGDGLTNDTLAIQTAIDYASQNNLSIHFPAGNYIASGLLYTNTAAPHIIISGECSGNTTISAPSGTTNAVFTIGVGGISIGPNQVRVEGLTFKGNYPSTYQTNSAPYTQHAFLIDTANHLLFDDCRFNNAKNGMTVRNGVVTHVSRCGAWYNEIGFYVATPGITSAGTTTFIDNSDAKNNHIWGVYFDNGRMITMTSCTVEGNGGNATPSGGFYVGTSTGAENGANFNAIGAVITKTWFEANAGSCAIYFRSGSNTVSDCNFTNSPTESIILIDGGRYFLERLRFENSKTYHIYEFNTSNVLSGNSVTDCFLGGFASTPANVLYVPAKTTVSVGGSTSGSWTNAALASGWTTYSGSHTVRYRKDGDIVRLAGALQYTSGTMTDVPMFTLPSGFRPVIAGFISISAAGGSNTHASVSINTSTGVVAATGTNAVIFLDGITFPTT